MLRTHQHLEVFLMLMLVYYNIKNGGRAGFIYIWKLNSIYKASQRCVEFRPNSFQVYRDLRHFQSQHGCVSASEIRFSRNAVCPW